MFAAFYHGARMTEWYQDRSKLVQSKEYKDLQKKVCVEIKSN